MGTNFYNKIGNLKPKNRILLAPLLEPNDIAFRKLCQKAGAGLVYKGMINPLSKQKLPLDDKPALQIFCTSTKGLKEFVKKHESSVSLFDYNLGCPSKIAKRLGFGSYQHNKLDLIENVLKILRSSTKKPITIKLRKSKQALKIAKMAEKYVDAIAIHPRTHQQGYSDYADIKFAEKLKSSLSTPVIYSGDVSEKNISSLLKKFDFVLIGREAIGDPGIFARINNTSEKNKTQAEWFREYLKLAKKYNIYLRQIKYQAMNFTKKSKKAKDIRRELMNAKTIKEIHGVMKELD
jgi:tRNA-dihydrouridine synthase B